MSVHRRTVLTGMLGASALVAAPAILRAQGAPMKIGFLTVKTGPLASGGIQMEQGLTLYLKERNNVLAGRPVQLFTGDSGGAPAVARTKMQEFVEQENIACLIGPLATAEALAIDDYIRDKQIPTLSVAAAEDMTQRKANPWFVRATSSSAQCSYAMGDYAAKELKLQARRHDRRRSSPTATSSMPASSAPSRMPAARWCRSCGRRSSRPTTAPISRSSSRTSM